MADWQWWVLGIVAFIWAMDIHRRVSETRDAVMRIETRINQMRLKQYGPDRF